MPSDSRAPLADRPWTVSVDCPAKINLHLRVGPARADGFHPLATWMCTVGLFDRLDLAIAADPDVNAGPIRLTCDPPTVPTDDRNLVVRAAKAMREARPGRHSAALDGRLCKRIPVGAGLGGGSSDAACALAAIDLLWPADGQPIQSTDLRSIAARLGSDVPFFLDAPSAACTGRGEVVRPLPPPTPGWAVLLLPPLAMPTPDVYRRFDALGLGRSADVDQEPDWHAWAILPAVDLLPLLVNDLEPPAFDLRPDLAVLREQAERVAGRPVRMSGSGSSLFTLFDGAGEAVTVADRLRASLGGNGTRCEAVTLAPPLRPERSDNARD